MADTVGTKGDWAETFLSILGAPVNTVNKAHICGWIDGEGTRAQWNPLATTQKWDGSTDFNNNNGFPVQNYPTAHDGMGATVKTITNGRYNSILLAIGEGTEAALSGVQNSDEWNTWGTGKNKAWVLSAAYRDDPSKMDETYLAARAENDTVEPGEITVPTGSVSSEGIGGNGDTTTGATHEEAFGIHLRGGRIPPFTNPEVPEFGFEPMTKAPLYRGWLSEFWDVSAEGAPPKSKWYRLMFQYNPGALMLDQYIDPDKVYNPVLQNAQERASWNQSIGNTLSFDMVFDRMASYGSSLANRRYQDQSLGDSTGVLSDVRIVEKILTNGMGGPEGIAYNVMPTVRVRFSRHGGGKFPPLNYIGFVTGTSIHYQRFNVDMVPTRCTISMSIRIAINMPRFKETALHGSGGEVGPALRQWLRGPNRPRIGAPIRLQDTDIIKSETGWQTEYGTPPPPPSTRNPGTTTPPPRTPRDGERPTPGQPL